MRYILLSLSLVFLLFWQCNAPSETSNTNLAVAPNNWIEERVATTETLLSQTDAGKVVWQAMEAHGGLANWYQLGPIRFHFNYQPLDGSTARNTHQTIDTWRSKAQHRRVDFPNHFYGWDGKKAWVKPDTLNMPYNVRFWSLTPYFFAAQPFVLGNEGTNLELLPEETYKDRLQDVVKVTFEDGVGDAPDDYYILYFDQETHQLGVIRYIVSYPGYFEKGKHLPEKFMALEGKQEVDNIIFPKAYKTYWWKNDSIGKHITNIDLSDISFDRTITNDYFNIPEAARVLEGL